MPFVRVVTIKRSAVPTVGRDLPQTARSSVLCFGRGTLRSFELLREVGLADSIGFVSRLTQWDSLTDRSAT